MRSCEDFAMLKRGREYGGGSFCYGLSLYVTLSQVIAIAEKGDTLGELVKCKPSKIYHTTKNSCQARHI
jgi:hypothetical protein